MTLGDRGQWTIQSAFKAKINFEDGDTYEFWMIIYKVMDI